MIERVEMRLQIISSKLIQPNFDLFIVMSRDVNHVRLNGYESGLIEFVWKTNKPIHNSLKKTDKNLQTEYDSFIKLVTRHDSFNLFNKPIELNRVGITQ